MFKAIGLWFHEHFGSCSKSLGAPEQIYPFVPVELVNRRKCTKCGKSFDFVEIRPSQMQAYHKQWRDEQEQMRSVKVETGNRQPERQREFQAQGRSARRAGAKHRAKVIPMSKYHDHDELLDEVAEVLEESIQREPVYRDPEPISRVEQTSYVEREPEPTPVSYDSPSSSYDSGSDYGD